MPPSLRHLLDPSRVTVGASAPTKAEALSALVALLDGHPAVADPARLAADVAAREAVMTTGVGEGLALPHARTPAVTESVAALATFAEPVPWASLDGEPVTLALLFAGPEAERRAHVRLLAHVSRVLAPAGVRRRLAEAGTPGALAAALAEAEDGPVSQSPRGR